MVKKCRCKNIEVNLEMIFKKGWNLILTIHFFVFQFISTLIINLVLPYNL